MADQSPRTPIREQDAASRIDNFDEVVLGYSAEEAVTEAKRCWQCKKSPCVQACPVNVRITEFIGYIADGEFASAYQTLIDTNSLPAICGRVCPQESQCEALCSRGHRGEPVAIGKLERFAADWHLGQAAAEAEEPPVNGAPDSPNAPAALAALASAAPPTPAKVALVGSGPASLTCAGDLAKLGYQVDILEALHIAGGVLVYGIPEFRLPKAIVAAEVCNLKQLGVSIRTNALVGRSFTIDELFENGYSAVFLGSGAGLPDFLGIDGENLLGVYSANEYLTRINLMKAYHADYDTPLAPASKVAVVGGGNVAMDAARCARRLGAEVTVIYRRGEAELPARIEEVHHAQQEGIEFCYLATPIAIHGDESHRVQSVECVAMELGEADETGRRRPFAKPDSNFTIAVDTLVVAIGTSPNPLIPSLTAGLDRDARGCLIVDALGATSKTGVFAGGDAVTGSATVIQAMGAGKTAALAIDGFIHKQANQ